MTTTDKQQKRSDIPTPIDINLGRSALTVKTTCKNCMHFKRIAASSYKKVCSELGIIPDAKPCDKFSPNPKRIRFSEQKHYRNIASAARELSDEELRLLAILLNQVPMTRKAGFNFGEIVYFRLYGGDYLKNYVKARVMFAERNMVHLQGTDDYIASVLTTSVFNMKKWNKKELALIRDNKIFDPSIERFTKAPSKAQLEMQKLEKPVPLDLSAALAGKGVLKSSSQNKGMKEFIERRTGIDKLLAVRG